MAGLAVHHQERLSRALANIILVALVVYLSSSAAKLTWLYAWSDRPVPDVPAQLGGQPGAQNRVPQASIAGYEFFGRPEQQAGVAEVVRRSAPETGLRLRLEGVLIGQRPEDSGAIVAGSNGETEYYRVGETLPGNAELAEVESDRLRQEMVRFFRRFLNEDAERDVSMLPMHTFWLGNDDRQFNRCVVVALGGEERLRSCYQPLTLDGLLKRISTAAWGVPMRFHGHVFLLALNIPFLSINYTGDGGKVSQLIDRYALADWSLSLQECFEEGAIWRRWERLLTRNEDRRARIRAQLDEDLRSLERIYELLWGERKASGSG